MFQTIHTLYGLQRIGASEATGATIKLTQMAVGDGGGNLVTLDPGQQHLVREMFRAQVNQVYQDPNDPTMFTAELLIPASVGGFTLREAGLYDDAGGLFAIANLPETYKPQQDGENAFSDTAVRMQFIVTNAAVIAVIADPNVVVATQSWIRNAITIGKLLPGGLTGQIPTKRSNADGDILWEDPTNVNVVVSTIEEQQTLAANQTTVDLVVTNTVGLAVYVAGQRLPHIGGTDGWQASTATRLVLGKSYTAGTRLTAVQNEPASQLGTPLQQALNLADLQDAPSARANLGVYSKAESDRLAPVSKIAYFACSAAPAGWLKANGAAISRTAYAALYAAIGTTFGAGDGFNTFNLPDLRGEFIRGLDDGRGVDAGRAIGSSQASQNLTHAHTGATDTNGTHYHGYTDGRPVNPPGSNGLQHGTDFPGVWERIDASSTDYAGAHSHNVTTTASGGSEARPRNVALLACIKF